MAKAKKPDSSGSNATPADKPKVTPKAADAKSAATTSAKDVAESKKIDMPKTEKVTGTSSASAAGKRKTATAKKAEVARAEDAKSVDAKVSEKSEPLEAKETKPAVTKDEKAVEKPVVPASEPPKPSPTPAPETKSSFVPLLFGGVIAAGLGFAASEANFMGWRTQDDSLRQALAAQSEEIEALKAAQIAPDLSGIEDGIAALDTRIAELEARPVATAAPTTAPTDGAAVEDVRGELSEMQAALEAQRSEIAELLGNAKSVEEATAQAARAAAGQKALAQVTAAISSGGGYASAIEDMQDAGITDLPAALTEPAADGVTTLINLQSRFPDAARAALADARAGATDDAGSGVGGFLRRQLGARSVTPREGTSADAVLSRAEAALRNGQVATALSEIDALPDGAKEALQTWIADAQVRAEAEAAVQDVSQRLTTN